jgi:uncharacterized membrane-anchored protein
MKTTVFSTNLAAFVTLSLSLTSADATNSSHLPTEELRWSAGPTTVSLRDVATLKIPEKYSFLNADQSKALLESLGNRTSGNEIGLIASESDNWSVVVEFHEVGYVSEDGWQTLDATAILEAIRETDRRANPEREHHGWTAIDVHDWESPPRYDPVGHTMEWAVRATSGKTGVINRVISVLVRRGVLQFILVNQHPSPATDSTLRQLLRGLAVEPGERYVDRQPGDRTAAGGLMRLVSGLEAPETSESSNSPLPATFSRTFSLANYWWLVGILTGVGGFLVGRRFRRHHRGRRSSRGSISRPDINPNNILSAKPTGRSLPLERGEEAARGPLASVQPVPSDSTRSRTRRCDAYSFYEKLTRDLHWTINY